jgi:hypothetical protein
MLDRALTWFVYVWCTLVFLLNIAVICFVFVQAPTLWQGWTRFQDIYSPYTISTHICNFVFISPAILAMYFRNQSRSGSTQAKVEEVGSFDELLKLKGEDVLAIRVGNGDWIKTKPME